MDGENSPRDFSTTDTEPEAAKILNKFGKFQIVSVLMLSPCYSFVAFIIIVHVFLNVVPDHLCRQPWTTHEKVRFNASFFFVADSVRLVN